MDDRPDARVTALTFLTPALFGLHSTLLPWLAVDDDDELYSFWSFLSRRVFEESSVNLWWWGAVLLGVGLAITGVVRAAMPDAAPSWVAAGAAALLVVLALGLPVVMNGAIEAAGDQSQDSVRWSGPVTLALAALWLSGAFLTGARRSGGGRGTGGWERPRPGTG